MISSVALGSKSIESGSVGSALWLHRFKTELMCKILWIIKNFVFFSASKKQCGDKNFAYLLFVKEIYWEENKITSLKRKMCVNFSFKKFW